MSETAFSDRLSRNNFRGNARQLGGQGTGLGKAVVNLASQGISALKDKALNAFDNANKGKVAEFIGPVFGPSIGSQPTNTGNKGNSGGNMMG